jgi:hypothetical protein
MKKLQDIVADIDKRLASKKYGFKESLSNSDKNSLTFEVEGLDNSEEYDCLYYNLKGKSLLEEQGIKTELVTGKDEYGLWNNHCYLRSDTGEIIDFTPIYPKIGAKHKDDKILTQQEAKEYLIPHTIPLNNMLPLHFNKKDKSLLRIGFELLNSYGIVKMRRKHIQIYLDLLKYKPASRRYEKIGELKLYQTGKKIYPEFTTLKSLINNNILTIEKNNNYKEIMKAESKIDKYIMNIFNKIL